MDINSDCDKLKNSCETDSKSQPINNTSSSDSTSTTENEVVEIEVKNDETKKTVKFLEEGDVLDVDLEQDDDDVEQESEEESDDDDGWITPANIKQVGKNKWKKNTQKKNTVN